MSVFEDFSRQIYFLLLLRSFEAISAKYAHRLRVYFKFSLHDHRLERE